MNKLILRRLLLGCLGALGFGVALPSGAAIDWQLPADSRIVYQSEVQEQNYQLMLGVYRRINNEWRTQGAETVSGMVSRKTIELPRGADEQGLFRALITQLPSRRELFSCTGLLCGTSNAWANTHFNQRILYGLDAHQFYGVYEVEHGEHLGYVVVYVVRRGNGSVMAQLEEVTPPSGITERLVTSAKSIANAVKSQGYFSIPLQFTASEGVAISAAQLQALANFLNDEGGSFTLVGHDYRPDQDHLVAGREHAAAVLALLKARNVRVSLGVFSVGRLAPAGRRSTPVRVDLVRD